MKNPVVNLELEVQEIHKMIEKLENGDKEDYLDHVSVRTLNKTLGKKSDKLKYYNANLDSRFLLLNLDGTLEAVAENTGISTKES